MIAERMGAFEPTMEQPRDIVAEYVAKARSGDAGAFEAVYNRFVGRIYGLSLRMTGCRDRAGDATQETFIRGFEKLGTLGADEAVGPWLQRICVNLILTGRRDDHSSPCEPDTFNLLPGPGGAASDRTAARLDLEQAVARLPERARMVFVLHDVYGYRHHEVARALAIAEGTSKAQLHRARTLLREVLQHAD